MDFEEIARKLSIPVLHIMLDGARIASGVCFPNSVFAFDDDSISSMSYPDTGVFILFVGSRASSPEKKFKPYISEDDTTTKEILFQSRNAAAKFVLGESGRTNSWKERVC